MFYGKRAGWYLLFMKQIFTAAILLTFFNSAFTQEVNRAVPTYFIKATAIKFDETVINCGSVESPAYIDSALFARYISWSLLPDSMPFAIRPAKGFTIEMFYVISKEGKIIEARAGTNEKKELIDYIIQKLVSCPYQWSPAYQNGRAVKSFQRLKINFDF